MQNENGATDLVSLWVKSGITKCDLTPFILYFAFIFF
jgi:hypothetical protein